MTRPIMLFASGFLIAVAAIAYGERHAPGCAGCATPPPPAPVAADPHVVTNDQCAVLELQLDSGVTKTICLTAAQLEKVLAQ